MKPYFIPTEITLRELAGSKFKELVAQDLTFVDADGIQWTAPVGTWTDGATVPRLALAITDGRYEKMFLKAAVVHDAYCQKENKDRRPPYQSSPWKEVHEMFHQACIAGGTPWLRARVMFASVRYFGPRWDDPESEAQQVPTDLALICFSATKQWIEKEQPSVKEIEADIAQRERVITRIYRLQNACLEAMETRDFIGAKDKLHEAESLISVGLERSPDDLMFLNLQGYQHKNRAMLQPDKKQEELNKAEFLFKAILASEPRDPSALNGLGSIEILRNNLGQAEHFIRQALEQEPDYSAAKHDLELVYKIRASRSTQ